jgi:hypothetical protein
MAVHYGKVAVGNNLGNAFISPLCGGLSDKYGRWAFQSYPRIGWIADVEIERRRAGTYM